MHSYLNSIGFSNANRIDDINRIIQKVMDEYDENIIVESKDGRCLCELIKYFTDEIGLKIIGEYDLEHRFHREYIYPFVFGTQTSTQEEVLVEKKLEADSYYGICDDVRIGSTLIFSLQDFMEYLRVERNNELNAGNKNVILSGLAHSGKILLPMVNSEKTPLERQAAMDRRSLMRAAQEGDRDAMESLTLEEFDMYSMIVERIEKEDVLSIVDTYIIPSGIESDEYNILGTITECSTLVNKMSGEELVVMQVETNEISIKICINRADLVGEPVAGRRFKGNIWLQGHVFF